MKAAVEREQCHACLSTTEREQARTKGATYTVVR